MKTITIKQPWASLIVEGIKDIENRTWTTWFRGRVLVHAGLSVDYDIINTENPTIYNAIKVKDYLFKDDIDAFCAVGAIIGSVEIVDCVVNHPSIWAEKRDGRLDSAKQWIEKPIYNWVLANPVLFAKPITNVKGTLSFWEYPMSEEEYLNIEKIGNPLNI